jgi:hypothetical protein
MESAIARITDPLIVLSLLTVSAISILTQPVRRIASGTHKRANYLRLILTVGFMDYLRFQDN